MEITVQMRAHRGLRRLLRYRPVSVGKLTTLQQRGAAISDGETIIGFYENIPGAIERGFLISDRGLHLAQDDGWLFLPYEAMRTAELEGGEKSLAVESVVVGLNDGRVVPIWVAGGDPEFGTRDTFAILMFLNYVIGDIARQAAASLIDRPRETVRNH